MEIKINNYPMTNPDNNSLSDLIASFQEVWAPVLAEIKENMTLFGNALYEAMQSPFIQWIQSIDFNPVASLIQTLSEISDEYKEINKAYLQAMYDCKWFPYVGWTVDVTLVYEVNRIITSSRGASKRRESRIDKLIFSYYTDAEIKNIKRSWKNNDSLDYCRKKIVGQAIEAHLRGEYALSISALATMWEGLLREKMQGKSRTNAELKEEIKEVVIENGFDGIIGDYYNNFIIRTCYSVDEVIDGVPNRHGVAHSWYRKYPNKKASLNAILLTDFLINLKPIEQAEETHNGQP